MLTMKETEAAYARFLSETNCKRLPKNADALFTQLEKNLRASAKPKPTAISRPLPPLCSGWRRPSAKTAVCLSNTAL